jgi:PHD/YefM family antitoxin component YafN of YafNO toxin-antitoxin module
MWEWYKRPYEEGNAMATVSMTYAREHFAELCDRVHYRDETVVITKGKSKRVAMIPIQNLDLLEKIERLIDCARAEVALEDVHAGNNTISLEDIQKALGIEDIADVKSPKKAHR